MSRPTPRWEQQLRAEFAGDLVWQHPEAAEIEANFRSNQPPKWRLDPQAGAILDAIVYRERLRRSRKRYSFG